MQTENGIKLGCSKRWCERGPKTYQSGQDNYQDEISWNHEDRNLDKERSIEQVHTSQRLHSGKYRVDVSHTEQAEKKAEKRPKQTHKYAL